MNPEPIFLTLEQIIELHQDSLAEFGGADGVRDQGMLESAWVAAENSYCYSPIEDEWQQFAFLAACYWFHLSSNHPFIDGNKRTALSAASTFLYSNGFRLEMDEVYAEEIAVELASGKIGKEELTKIVHTHLVLR